MVGQELGRRELVVVTGKGGVGKSTLAAALGRMLAGRGRRALVLEVDPRDTLHRLLDTPPSDGEVVEAGPRLWHQNLRPRSEIEALIRRKIPIPLVGRAVAASPVFHHFVEGAPGLRELAILGHALRLVQGETGPGVDTVVLDAPATGHGVSLLAAPQLAADVLGRGPVAQLARELAAFVADRTRCGVVVATLAEEMPVQEAIELVDLLGARIGRPPELVVVNALYPAVPVEVSGAPEAVELWRERRRVNETEMARLSRAWPGSTVRLPLLPLDPGPALVAALAERLVTALSGSGEGA